MSRGNRDGKTSKNTLKRLDIARLIHQEIGLNSTESAELVGRVFNEISKFLTSGEDVKLAGFGTFKLRQKKARFGRNPKTGQECIINSRQVVTFKPSIAMKERVAFALATETDLVGSGDQDPIDNVKASNSTPVRENGRGRSSVDMERGDWTALFELLGSFAFAGPSSTDGKMDVFFRSILELQTIIDPKAAITKDSLTAWVKAYQTNRSYPTNNEVVLLRFKRNLVTLQNMPHKSDVIFAMVNIAIVNIAIVEDDFDDIDKSLISQAILDWEVSAKVVSDIEYVCPEIVQVS